MHEALELTDEKNRRNYNLLTKICYMIFTMIISNYQSFLKICNKVLSVGGSCPGRERHIDWSFEIFVICVSFDFCCSDYGINYRQSLQVLVDTRGKDRLLRIQTISLHS